MHLLFLTRVSVFFNAQHCCGLVYSHDGRPFFSHAIQVRSSIIGSTLAAQNKVANTFLADTFLVQSYRVHSTAEIAVLFQVLNS